MSYLDLIALWVGRVLLLSGGVALAIFVLFLLIDYVVRSTGSLGIIVRFGMEELRKKRAAAAKRQTK